MGLLNVLDKFESFVGVNFWTMIFAWVNLLILYLFLRKLLFNPLMNMITSRQKEIDDSFSEAESSKQSALELRREYEERLEGANDECEALLKNATRRAELKKEEILKEAAEEAQRTLERAEEQIELEKKQALNDIKNDVAGMAIGIAAKVIERDVNADEHRELIDNFIENLGKEE